MKTVTMWRVLYSTPYFHDQGSLGSSRPPLQNEFPKGYNNE